MVRPAVSPAVAWSLERLAWSCVRLVCPAASCGHRTPFAVGHDGKATEAIFQGNARRAVRVRFHLRSPRWWPLAAYMGADGYASRHPCLAHKRIRPDREINPAFPVPTWRLFPDAKQPLEKFGIVLQSHRDIRMPLGYTHGQIGWVLVKDELDQLVNVRVRHPFRFIQRP